MVIGRSFCLAAGAVCFAVGAVNVPGLNWLSLGLCFVTLSWLVG